MTNKRCVARWSINWSDEMDIEGSALISGDWWLQAKEAAEAMDRDGYDDEAALTMWLGTNQSVQFKSFKDVLDKVKVKAFGQPDQELAEVLEFAMTYSYCVPLDFIMETWAYYQEDEDKGWYS